MLSCQWFQNQPQLSLSARLSHIPRLSQTTKRLSLVTLPSSKNNSSRNQASKDLVSTPDGLWFKSTTFCDCHQIRCSPSPVTINWAPFKPLLWFGCILATRSPRWRQESSTVASERIPGVGLALVGMLLVCRKKIFKTQNMMRSIFWSTGAIRMKIFSHSGDYLASPNSKPQVILTFGCWDMKLFQRG